MSRGRGKTVSLVLGSGGARGLAHIGVIEWLDEQGYRIESIAGASMGALVGGIYAAGELDTYRNWVCALSRGDVLRFLDFAFSAGGLFKGDRIIDTLREMVGEHAIEDLPISYTAVATDIERQREVWISKGPLFDAIRASIAVPSIFTPHEYLGLTLLDGGLLNPVPIAPTFRDLTDLTIAVNLNGQRPRTEEEGAPPAPPAAAAQDDSYRARIHQFLDDIQESWLSPDSDDVGMFEMLNRSFETMQNAVAAVKLAAYAPDVVINVPADACVAHEFHRAREMIELGYRLAAATVPARMRG
ncbi:MAG: patatin-like phospholipase family protein [Pseudomonadota bacterium]|nr:patatin-like phospholipase family protein [Pseudomonadota bacterium]